MEIINQSVKNSLGESLSCVYRRVDSSNPVVITLHALSGMKENRSIHALATSLPEKGFSTLEFDFSGHGESEGVMSQSTVTKQLSDLKLVIDYFKFESVVLVGNSFSVVTTLAFAKQFPDLVSGLVLISGRADYLQFCENTRKENYVLFGDNIIDESYLDDYKQYNPIKNISQLDISTCIVHGTADETISVSDAKIFFDSSLSLKKELILIEGGAHRFNDEHREEMLIKVTSFLKNNF